jgi:DNA-binding NarL/FixJ family response regulator
MSISKTNEGRLRVVAADNNKPMLDKVVLMLQDDFDVVATAADGSAALEMIQLLQPEVAVLDISMPNKTGIEVADELKSKGSDVKVVILTVHDDPDYVRAALNAGALGYILKSHMAADLKPAVLAVRDGNVFISPSCVMSDGHHEPISH